MLKKCWTALLLLIAIKGMGHPMPHSVFILNIKSAGIEAELKLPLKELQFAVPFDVTNNTPTLIQNHSAELTAYILAHLHPRSVGGEEWNVALKKFSLSETEQTATGKYQELTASLWLQTPKGESVRHFNLFYDGIVHQLVTHKIFVSINQDWQNGQLHGNENDVAIIEMGFPENIVHPIEINIDEGSAWKGFRAMVHLGIEHIAEGTDHLLFLLVLLLPATLVVRKRRWAEFGGTKYSLIRLLKIATAFTIGHSVSLLLGAMKWVVLPQQPVEVAIAITILITAVHAMRPLFFRKEILVATGFGLIHGLAFATVLARLNLEAGKMALSILGFNVGIELMQLFVILLTVPWLIIMSSHPAYKYFRTAGASVAMLAAFAWLVERITLRQNFVSMNVEKVAIHGKNIVLFLALLAIGSLLHQKFKTKRPT